jgi:hypothetical protein
MNKTLVDPGIQPVVKEPEALQVQGMGGGATAATSRDPAAGVLSCGGGVMGSSGGRATLRCGEQDDEDSGVLDYRVVPLDRAAASS